MSPRASGRASMRPALPLLAAALALAAVAAVAVLSGCGGGGTATAGTGTGSKGGAHTAKQSPVSAAGVPALSAGPSRKLRGCFSAPARCGYPSPANTGVHNCAALRPSGSVTARTPGQRIENLDITGTITVAAPGVRIRHVCVTTDGEARLASAAVRLEQGATGTTISDATIRGADGAAHSVEIALDNDYGNAGAVASRVQLYNCGECLHQTWALRNSYVDANGMKGTSDHFEDWYYSDTSVQAISDTLLNPEEQTAVLFGDTHVGAGGPCDNHLTVTGSLIAGGGAMFYPCGNASGAGTSTMTVAGNRFARCLTRTRYEAASGGSACAAGPDSHGFFPKGGFFFPAAYVYSGPGQVWRGNVWDDNGRSVPLR